MKIGAGRSPVQRLRGLRPGDYGIVWVTIGLFVLLTQTTDVFLSAANLRNVLDQQSLLLIAGSAMTLTLIGGNFDISVSASFINAGIVTALIANGSDSVVAAIAGGVGIGAAFGLLNGVIVAWVRINSFIATLATSFVFYGVGFLLSERSIIRIGDRSFSDVARPARSGSPMPPGSPPWWWSSCGWSWSEPVSGGTSSRPAATRRPRAWRVCESRRSWSPRS